MAACRRPRSLARRSVLALFGLSLFLAASAVAADPPAGPITGYRAVHQPFVHTDGSLRAVVRQYRQGNEERVLVLDADRFRFAALPASAVSGRPRAEALAWQQTAFAQALARHTAPPYPLQNDGLRQAEGPVAGYFLTADLCPSRRPLDRAILEALAELPLPKPLPISLMVSSLWMDRHGADLAWLKEQVAAGNLAVTWGNHSANHYYDPAAPLERNFLLKPGTDLAGEILGPEKSLLEQGLVPSPFFRFPGLVSDQGLVTALIPYSLIPIGADAWLAKGEVPKPGSIILVHANGNEPEGILRLRAFLAAQESAFRKSETRLLPLAEAFAGPSPQADPPR